MSCVCMMTEVCRQYLKDVSGDMGAHSLEDDSKVSVMMSLNSSDIID